MAGKKRVPKPARTARTPMGAQAALEPHEAALFDRAAEIIESARRAVVRTTRSAMVHAYWLIGRDIVEVEQHGAERATYGDELLDRLGEQLSTRFGRGFSARTLRRMRQFYLVYPQGSAVLADGADEDAAPPEIRSALRTKSPEGGPRPFPSSLGWTHYRILIRLEDDGARAFYEIEAAREAWSTRELERQIGAHLYARLAKSRDPEAVRRLAREGQRVEQLADVLKDPTILEFVDLGERAHWHERDLEQAIIDRLEAFLLELGKGFCFVARQKRLTIDGDHFYVDLTFYNRLLRCFVLVELKLGKLTHQDLGQLQMYVNYFDRFERQDFEAPTVGIVLCSDKNDAMVRITLPEDNTQIHASRYQLYLPTEAELRDELRAQREALEHHQALDAADDGADEPNED